MISRITVKKKKKKNIGKWLIYQRFCSPSHFTSQHFWYFLSKAANRAVPVSIVCLCTVPVSTVCLCTVHVSTVPQFYMNNEAIKPTITLFSIRPFTTLFSPSIIICPWVKNQYISSVIVHIFYQCWFLFFCSITALIPLVNFFKVTSQMQSSPWGRSPSLYRSGTLQKAKAHPSPPPLFANIHLS